MRRILILGAGRVSSPCVRYLLDHADCHVIVADQNESHAAAVAGGHPRASARSCDARDGLDTLLSSTRPDLVINLLPAAMIALVARKCLERRIDMINVSYLNDDIRSLDAEAKRAGVMLLCELGLDPGIDHMSAAKTIHEIRERGGQVRSFWSCCGALPAAESNTNPFGYKLSWAPTSLIGASKREARIRRQGKTVILPPGETFRHTALERIEGIGCFEHYANADSLPYIALYGIEGAEDVYRGTLRYPGWCETIRTMLDLGLFEEKPMALEGLSFRTFTARLTGLSEGAGLEKALENRIARAVLHRLEWLGLFADEPIARRTGTPRDVVGDLFQRKLVFQEGERDLVVMEHRYEATLADGRRLRRISTLVDYGVVGKETSIARTTGLPPAIAAKLALEGKIGEKGVLTPVLPEIYEPSLAELKRLGIVFSEREELR